MYLFKYNKWLSNRNFLVVILAIVSCRLSAIVILDNINIINDSGLPIRFGGVPAFLDYILYKNQISNPWSEITRPLHFFYLLLEDWHAALVWIKEQPLKPGPIYPMLLGITGFEFHRYLLSWIYLIAGALLGWHWVRYLKDVGTSLLLKFVTACFPALVYYSLLVSTDLLYACLIALWLIGARGVLEKKEGALSWTVVCMFLLLLTKPNSLALLPLMSLITWKVKSLKAWLLWSVFWGVVGVYMLVYYLPYYWVHDRNGALTHYWGLLPSEYYKGLWADVPVWISQPLSWVLFVISKLLHSVGLRPSYSSVEMWLVLVRAFPGLVFLPGIIYLFFTGHWFEKWFVFFYMLPIFIGASQERYLLALTPILLLWGVRAWSRAGRWGYRQLGFKKN